MADTSVGHTNPEKLVETQLDDEEKTDGIH
jgi:hypothetical protein